MDCSKCMSCNSPKNMDNSLEIIYDPNSIDSQNTGTTPIAARTRSQLNQTINEKNNLPGCNKELTKPLNENYHRCDSAELGTQIFLTINCRFEENDKPIIPKMLRDKLNEQVTQLLNKYHENVCLNNNSKATNQNKNKDNLNDVAHLAVINSKLDQIIANTSPNLSQTNKSVPTQNPINDEVTNDPKPSYAQVAKKPVLKNVPAAKMPNYAKKLLIRTNKNNVKSTMQKLTQIQTEAKIEKIKVNQNEITIKCSNSEDVPKLKDQLNEYELRATQPKQKRQNIIITNVRKTVTFEDIKNKIHETLGTDQTNFPVKLFKKKQSRNNELNQHWLLSVTLVSANILVDKTREFYFGLQRSRIDYYQHVIRCNNCQNYGHQDNSCKFKSYCANCGETHHSLKCPKPETNYCRNCHIYNARCHPNERVNCNHKASASDCATFLYYKGYWQSSQTRH